MLARPPPKQHTHPQPFFIVVHVDYFSRKTGNPKVRTWIVFPELEKLAIASKTARLG
jgi:hypothetical protein